MTSKTLPTTGDLLALKEAEAIQKLPPYLKDKILNTIQYAIDLEGQQPSNEQLLSDRFYRPEIDESSLLTGDLIDLKELNKCLTEKIKKLQIYNEDFEDFGSTFYPYFFKKYEYGVVATQSCKIVHRTNNPAHTIELCAVKPISLVSCYLLSNKLKKARSKIATQNQANDMRDKYRRLFDQQLDNFFFYFPKMQRNKQIRPAYVTCIDVKVPIRIDLNSIDTSIDCFLSAKVDSISSDFEHKLSEKIGRYYFNVALEDNVELFKFNHEDNSEEQHQKWIENQIEKLLLIEDDANLNQQMNAFIALKFGSTLTVENIWEQPDNLQIVLDEYQRLKDNR